MSRPVAMITGASSGIGRACAVGCARNGFDVAIAARRTDDLESLSESIVRDHGCRVMVRGVDLHDHEETVRVVPEVLEHFGRLDALLNVAGIADMTPLHEMSLGSLQRSLVVNTIAPALLVREAWPALARAPRGVVINISSLASIDPLPGGGAYGMSKSAIEGLMRSIHVESAASEAGIRSFALAPGCIDTPMLRSALEGIELPDGAEIPMDEFVGHVMDCVQGVHDDFAGETIFVARQGHFSRDVADTKAALQDLWGG